jgi:hypothetical protein
MDKNGKPFIQSAHAVDVTRHGGRLRDLYCLDKTGDVIRVQHGNQKANFRISWIGHPGTAEDGHIGIYCIEPEKYIWGVPLPKKSSPDDFEVEEEKTMLTFSEHPLGSTFAGRSSGSAGPGLAAAAALKAETRPGKKRANPRYPVSGSAEVAPEGSTMPVWCVLSDISVSGCYAETTSPLPVNTRVHVVLKMGGTDIQARGLVRTSHPGVGMGVNFTNLTSDDKERLAALLEKISHELESGSRAASTDIIPSSFSRPVAENSGLEPAATKPEAAPKNIDEEIIEKLKRQGTELWEIEQLVSSRPMHSLVSREFRMAMEHARQSGWAVQHWVDLQTKERDPFHVLHKLNSDRISKLVEASRNLINDLEGGEIDIDAQGLDDLYSSIKELYARLASLLRK